MSRKTSTNKPKQNKTTAVGKSKTAKTETTASVEPKAQPVKRVIKKKAGKSKTTNTKPSDASTVGQATAKTSQSLAQESLPPATARVESKHSVAENTDKPKSSRGIAWLALACGLTALLAGGYAAYQTSIGRQVTGAQVGAFDDRLKTIASDQQSLNSHFDTLTQKTGQLGESTTSQVQQVGADLAAAQASIDALQTASNQSIEAVKANLGASVARWKLDEVHSLLSRVNQYYQLTGNKVRALAGLKLAQSSLATIDNPRIASVKAAMAEDILHVEAASEVDVAALNDRLMSISALIPELTIKQDKPMPASSAADADTAKATSADTAKGGILSIGKALLGDIGSLVQHKNLDAPLKPSLDDSAKFILYESLQLKLQAANVAMLRQHTTVYQSQLESAKTLLQSVFDTETPAAKTILAEFGEMQKQDIGKQARAISGALSALNKMMLLEN